MELFFDIKKFNLLFNEYHERFILFATGYVKERETAKDFVSEAFTTFWEKRHQLSPDTQPQTYIMTIIKNKCLNYLHHKKIERRIFTTLRDHSEWVLQTKISTLEACDPGFLFSDEMQQIVNSTLQQLPEKTRRIFLMSRNQSLSYSEIAKQNNLSLKSVEFHISKALRQLRLSLSEFITLL